MPTFGNTVVYTTETPVVRPKPGYWDTYSELEATPAERLAAML
jgi:hypothetical protein